MFDRFWSSEAGQWASTILVVLVGAFTGERAAQGMTPMQWAGAAVAIAGAVSLAVIVRCWPRGERE